jgi:hypothetical protein
MAGYITTMLAIPGVEGDDELRPQLLFARKEGYAATRCFHSARTFMDREQWPQAYVLFQRAMDAAAAAAANSAAGAAKHEVEALRAVGSKAEGLMAATRARGFFAANEAELRLSDDMSQLTLAAQGERLGLMDRLGKIVPEGASLSDPSLSHLASFPPAFKVKCRTAPPAASCCCVCAGRHRTVLLLPPNLFLRSSRLTRSSPTLLADSCSLLQELSCRPLLFDIASDGLAFPSLEEFKGKTGLLGRLFGR